MHDMTRMIETSWFLRSDAKAIIIHDSFSDYIKEVAIISALANKGATQARFDQGISGTCMI